METCASCGDRTSNVEYVYIGGVYKIICKECIIGIPYEKLIVRVQNRMLGVSK